MNLLSLPAPMNTQEKILNTLNTRNQNCQYTYDKAFEDGTFTPLLAPQTKIVLADNNVSAFMMFYTPFRSVVSNCHRNEAGYRDLVTVLEGKTADVAAIVRTRGIDALALCAAGKEQRHPNSFMEAVQTGNLPPWLRKVGTGKFAKNTLLLQVDKSKLPSAAAP